MDANFHPAIAAIKAGDLDKLELQSTIDGWSADSRDIINNAFVYACMHKGLSGTDREGWKLRRDTSSIRRGT